MNATLPSGRHAWDPSNGERWIYRGASGVLTVALFFMLRILTWLAFPGQGFVAADITVPQTVQAGTLMIYQVNFCQQDGRTPAVLTVSELELEDRGTSIPLSGLAHTTTANCEVKVQSIGIPGFTPPGPYRLKVTSDLQANPLRRVRQEYLTAPFTITERK